MKGESYQFIPLPPPDESFAEYWTHMQNQLKELGLDDLKWSRFLDSDKEKHDASTITEEESKDHRRRSLHHDSGG